MLLWVILSISAALIWAICNLMDKYVLTKWVSQPLVPIIIAGLLGLIASIFVFVFHRFSNLSYSNILLAIIAGILYILMAVFYFKAMQIEEASRIIPIFYLSTLVILIFAAIFIGEIFTPIKYLGIFLLTIGAILISSRTIKIKFNKSFWWMIIAMFALSVNQIITKYLLNFSDFWTIFSYIRIGTFIGIIPIMLFYFKDLIHTVKKHGARTVMVMSANETINLIGIIAVTIAASIGSITLVNALSSIQPFFVLLFAVLLSIFFPKIIKEEIDKKTIIIKTIAVILMFIGVIIVS